MRRLPGFDGLLALSAGLILAMMVHSNSLLAKHTSPVVGSWIVHGSGAFTASLLLLLPALLGSRAPRTGTGLRAKPSRWLYSAGVAGAFTVILGSVAVNSELALYGSIAFMLTGQVLFGLFSDQFGLFGTPRKPMTWRGALSAAGVIAGSALVLYGKASP